MPINIEHELIGWSYKLPAPHDRELGIMVKHAVEAYGFLIPVNTTVTGEEFADLIEGYYDEPRSKALAAALRTI